MTTLPTYFPDVSGETKPEMVKIPRWLVTLIGGQTIGVLTAAIAFAWWASSVTTELKTQGTAIVTLNTKIEKMVDDRYRAVDAARDFASVHLRIDNSAGRILEIEKECRELRKLIGTKP